ncbi:hypothetical protein M011DRAFT_466260 [Sporormia fimetaria CBS 119925]|uniref:Uncharacterized protein n=1 Tax=Sporormia fimetaria CBS 119925 TaxID=1340428 RepID=A0A6A6VEW5_9PLEO|nr:hypothetical protein M011DRAFT_466260 [Sporormia fimetaria CBS 119925]
MSNRYQNRRTESGRLEDTHHVFSDINDPWGTFRRLPEAREVHEQMKAERRRPVAVKYATYTDMHRPKMQARPSEHSFEDFIPGYKMANQAILDYEEDTRKLLRRVTRAGGKSKGIFKSAARLCGKKETIQLRPEWDPHPEQHRYERCATESAGIHRKPVSAATPTWATAHHTRAPPVTPIWATAGQSPAPMMRHRYC